MQYQVLKKLKIENKSDFSKKIFLFLTDFICEFDY